MNHDMIIITRYSDGDCHCEFNPASDGAVLINRT